ncbi:MAG TPA: purine-cytosine permease-like transporter [Isosphaeraceae bacterium]|jgi:cytosine permease|nr:purine-cytosine permease-like transporter [Isosphaeraceae bacterium]
MTDESPGPGLSAPLRAALEAEPTGRKSWQYGIAPHYIGLFLWIVFFDQLARRTLTIGGLPMAVSGAATAGLLGYLFLFYAPAMLGLKTGRPLAVVASSTFGARGSTWLPGVVLGLGQVVWFAVATAYATDFCLRGLVAAGLIAPEALRPLVYRGWSTPGSLFLVTAACWCAAIAPVGHVFMRWIGALMHVYPVFLAAMLAATMIWALAGLASGVAIPFPLPYDPRTAEPIVRGGPRAFATMIQLVFGFTATTGLIAVDWGAASREARDVRLGGLIGVGFTPAIVATLALMTIAVAAGRGPGFRAELTAQEQLDASLRRPRIRGVDDPTEVLAAQRDEARRAIRALGDSRFTYGHVLEASIGGRIGGAMMLLFGLGSMAPAVYAAWSYGQRFAAIGPRPSRWAWTFLGALAGFLLIASGVTSHLEEIFTAMGAVFAPVVGALAADALRHRRAWPGPRRGVNVPGVAAWLVGLGVGLLPLLGRLTRPERFQDVQPAAVLAFLAAFATYGLLALLRLESRPIPLPEAPAREVGAGQRT